MSIHLIPFDEITESHLYALVEASTRESYCLEFKKEPPSAEGAEIEFSKDISALSNWVGGDIIYGMAEKDQGAASKIFPVGEAAEAQRVLDRWQAIADSRIAPRIPGLRFRSIALKAGGFVMIIRVPKSYIAPHAVRVNHDKGQLAYWIRTDAHVRPMSEDEVRRRYVSGPDLVSKIDRVRYANVLSGSDTVAGPYYESAVRVHCLFVPIEGLLYEANHSNSALKAAAEHLKMDVGYSAPTPCLEGCFRSGGEDEGIGYSWCVHRNGTVGWTDAGTNRVWGNSYVRQPERCLRPKYENVLMARVDDVKKAFASLGVVGQVAICLSLTRVKGAEVSFDDMTRYAGVKCPYDEIHAPPVIVNSPDSLSLDSIKPCFDLVMNAFGIKESVAKHQ